MGKKLLTTALIGATVAGLYAISNAELDMIFPSKQKGDALYSGSPDIARVIQLQENLQDIKYSLICGANGIYSSDTEKVVKWFQKHNGIEATGLTNAKTEKAIATAAYTNRKIERTFGKAPISVTSIFMRTTTKYTKPEAKMIRNWQAKLMQIGHNLAPCYTSGVIDEATEKAIIKFQTINKIYPISGILDTRTQNAINEQGNPISAIDLMAAYMGAIKSTDPNVQKFASKARNQHLEHTTQYFIDKKKVPEYLARDIQYASLRTGWDINYMFMISGQESSHKAWAAANCKNCTATGPFQFIKQTWLLTLKKYGSKYGYKDIAKSIKFDGKRYHVPKGAKGQYIYDLRKNTKIASLMAAEFAKSNHRVLVSALGKVGRTEIYMAHFFGATAAVKFIKAYRTSPKAFAATIFVKAAGSNKHVFYKKGNINNPRTVNEVYDYFKRKIAPNGQNALRTGPAIDRASSQNVAYLAGNNPKI